MALNLDTVIESVTVYPERALVTRRGAATLETAGEHTLRISGLPQTVLRNSLRATGTGPAGTRILGIEQVAEIHPAPPEEDARRLRDGIARLRREIALISERQGIIEQQRDWLRALGLQSARLAARGIFGESARPEDAGAAFTYAAGESERLAAAKLELETRREELQREQAARERELAELGNRQRPDRIAADVRIETPAGGRVEVRLAYLVYGASWQPRYDARVDTTAFTVRLTQQALVSQRTGKRIGRVSRWRSRPRSPPPPSRCPTSRTHGTWMWSIRRRRRPRWEPSWRGARCGRRWRRAAPARAGRSMRIVRMTR